MPDTFEPRRLYGDKEISRIIKRAAELQEQKGRAGSAGPGISIAELEQIARDLGIDPTYLRQAVAELGSGIDTPAKSSLLGETLIEARRLVKSEMSDLEWEMMVQEIRRALGCTGETGKLGNAVEWKTSDKELVTYQVTASPREGQTDIQIVSRRDGAAFLTYFVSGLLGLFTALSVAAPSFSNPVELLAAGGVLVGVMTTARLLVGRWSRKQKQVINRLVDKLETIVRESAPRSIGEPVPDLRPPLPHEEPEQLEEMKAPRSKERA